MSIPIGIDIKKPLPAPKTPYLSLMIAQVINNWVVTIAGILIVPSVDSL
jgi:hypothetical protein